MKEVIIYTDGACRGNPGPGAWACLLQYGEHEKTLSGYEAHTTNNKMELMATIQALRLLKENCTVKLYTDSKYVQQGITEWIHNWKKNQWRTSAKKPVKNAELWQQLDELVVNFDVHWHWVKGHAGHPGNERVDQLANEAIDSAG